MIKAALPYWVYQFYIVWFRQICGLWNQPVDSSAGILDSGKFGFNCNLGSVSVEAQEMAKCQSSL